MASHSHHTQHSQNAPWQEGGGISVDQSETYTPNQGYSEGYVDEYYDEYYDEPTKLEELKELFDEAKVTALTLYKKAKALPFSWWRNIAIGVVVVAIALGMYVLLKDDSSAVASSGGGNNTSQVAAAAAALGSDDEGSSQETNDDIQINESTEVPEGELDAFGNLITDTGGSFGVFSSLGTSSSTNSSSGGTFTVSSGSSTTSGSSSNTNTSGSSTNTTPTNTNSTNTSSSNTTTNTNTTQNQNVFTPTTSSTVPVVATLTNVPPALTSSTTTSVNVAGTNVTQYKYRLDTSAFVGPYGVSQPIQVTVGDGTHTLHVVGGDAQGNFQTEGDATSVVWAVDTTAPTAQITGISGNVVSSDTTTLTIGGSGTAFYRYSLDGGSYSGELSVGQKIVLTGLSEGQHTIAVVGRDLAGNYQSTTTPSVLTWTVDHNAPQVSAFTVGVNTDRATFQWSTSETTEATLLVGLRDGDYSYSDTHGTTTTTTDHSLTVAGLQSCSTFYYKIASKDQGGFEAVQTGTITTDGCTGFAEVLSQTDSHVSYNIGGSLHLLDNSGLGMELIVPAYFAGDGLDAQFQIKKLEKNAYVNALQGPSDVSRVGDYIYRLSALKDISTLISSFEQNLTVRIYYDPNDLNGVPENTLSIRRHDGVQWNHLANCSVNTTAHFVTCTTDHFSDFELFGETPKALTGISDTLSDSDRSVTSSHTIRYTSSTTVTAGEEIAFAFDDATDKFDGWESLGTSDVTFTGATLVTSCGAGSDEVTMAVRTDTENEGMRFTVCPGDSVGGGAKVITIASGIITNPDTVGSYVIKIRSGSDDNADEFAKTRVAVIDDVVVTAKVEPVLTFLVLGVASGQPNANDSGTTSITTTSTAIPWGDLDVNVPKTARQDLGVATNARNGFSVTVFQDQNLTSGIGADIDTFQDGSNPGSPVAWTAPSNNVADENTYGHFGITTDDETLSGGDTFGSALYDAIGDILSPLEIFYHSGPADGSTLYKGKTSVGYKIEIGPLQESAEDYASTLTYIATPVF